MIQVRSEDLEVARDEDMELMNHVTLGNIAGVQMMLNAGADIDGSTFHLTWPQVLRPIIAATCLNNLDMIKFLVARGAMVDAMVPIHWEPEGHKAALQGCICFEGERAIHLACRYRHYDIVRYLLEAGSDPNLPDAHGSSPLYGLSAVAGGTPGIVRELLQAGADPALTASEGWTALHVAAFAGQDAVLTALLKHSPELLDAQNEENMTPLGAAVDANRPGTVSFLLSAGASQVAGKLDYRIHPLVAIQKRPMAMAAIQGFEEVVRILGSQGVEAVGGHAVFTVVQHCYLVCGNARMLGAVLDVDESVKPAQCIISRALYTMLHVAAGLADLFVMHVLLARGEDETAVSSDDRTPHDVTGMMDRESFALSSFGPDSGLRLPGFPKNRDATIAATRRMLARGPAFRARSWVWPAGGGGGGGGAEPCGGFISDASHRGGQFGVRVVRRRSKTTCCLPGILSRYASKR